MGRGSYSDIGVIYDLIVEKRIFIITPWKTYDPKNDSDLLQIRFEMFMSREEWESIRRRLVGARHELAERGMWMAPIPYGYKRNEKMRLEPYEEEAKWVRSIYNWYVNEHFGYRAIKKCLEDLGVLSPKGKKYWDESYIRRLIENDVYIGVLRYRQTSYFKGKIKKRDPSEHIVVLDSHEPLVSEDLFYEARRIHQKRKCKPKNQKTPIVELTGLIVCGECGRKMTVHRYTRFLVSGEERGVMSLRCKNGCSFTKYGTALDGAEKMLRLMKDIGADRKKLNRFMAEYETVKNKRQEESYLQAVEIKSTVTQRINVIKGELKTARDKLIKGVFTDEEYLEIKTEKTAQIKALEEMEQSSAEAVAAVEDESQAEKIMPYIRRKNAMNCLPRFLTVLL